MEMAAGTEELSLVITESFDDIISHKWESYGRKHHFLGLFMHVYYLVVFTLYVIKAYIQHNGEKVDLVYLILLISGMIYPTIYEFIQLYK